MTESFGLIPSDNLFDKKFTMKILTFLVCQLYALQLSAEKIGKIGPPAPPDPSKHVFTPGNCKSSNQCDNGRNMCNFDYGNYGFCENCLHFRFANELTGKIQYNV